MNLTQNQFFGYDKLKDPKGVPGSLYIATDTKRIYVYDSFGDPKLASSGVIGGGGGSEIIASLYTDLPVGEDEDTIAFVTDPQGTKWLPGTLGGTYYPPGWYIYKSGVWRHSREFVDEQLYDFNLDIDALETGLTAHAGRTDNPHFVTATQIGLGNVDNTSDVNKPISSATTAALLGKSNTGHTHVKSDITDFNENDYATGAEGNLAATAVQPLDNVSDLTNDALYISQGDDISLLVNDEVYLQATDNVSALTNDAGYISANPITSYRSDQTDFIIYSGWLDGVTPVIKKCDDGVETFATGLTDLETDWTNRLNLTYI